jgi:hypothetical protein
MESITQNTVPTFESVWASLQETSKLQKENERLFKEKSAETDRQMKESRADFDRQMKESRSDFEQRMKKMEKTLGSLANNQGRFAEEYFFNSFDKGQQNFFGERFDEIEQNVKGIKKEARDEYDIVLINGKSIGIVEIKFKAHETDIPEVLRKAETFRINFPDYKDHKIYLGLATMAFYPELEQECINHGIAVIKQVGDTIVINDGHLKVF